VIRQPDGRSVSPRHSQGLGFEWWEIVALAKLEGLRYGVTLGHLAETVRRTSPELKDIRFEEGLREGLTTALLSKHEGLRFWARFIVEQGYHAVEPYDLLQPGDLRGVRLNPVQLAFLLSRLAGEIGAIGRPSRSAAAGRDGSRWSPAGFFAVVSAQPPPCGFSDELSLAADWFALASTSVLGQMLGSVSDPAGVGAQTAKMLGAANAVSTLLKFVLTYAFIKTDITMDAEEMIRTKDRDPGDYRKLTAKVTIEADKSQYLNCLRQMLNLIGERRVHAGCGDDDVCVVSRRGRQLVQRLVGKTGGLRGGRHVERDLRRGHLHQLAHPIDLECD
jgi:hypothetical protein